MKNFKSIALIATAAAFAATPAIAAESSQSVQASAEAVAAPEQVKATGMLYSSDGRRIGRVNRLDANGNPQIILNARLITISAETLSEVDGKLTTSLTHKEAKSAN